MATPLAKKLKQNVDKIVMAVLWIMVAGLGYMWFLEQNSTVGADAETGKPANLTDPITENPNWAKISKMSQNPDISQYPQIQQAAQYNMFDYKSVRDRQEIEKGAQQKFEQA